MPISHFRNLQCWQLANALRVEVIAVCDRERVARDADFCSSFRSTASSVCRNLAEGFGRYESREIVLFFRYALASLAEVQDHLEECRQRRFLDAAEFDRLWDIAEHTKATATRFMKPHESRARPRPGRSRR
jgi:four helix bundle protein